MHHAENGGLNSLQSVFGKEEEQYVLAFQGEI